MIGTAWAADAHGGGGGLFSDPTFWVAVSFVIFLALAGKQIVKGLTKLLDDRTALMTRFLDAQNRVIHAFNVSRGGDAPTPAPGPAPA